MIRHYCIIIGTHWSNCYSNFLVSATVTSNCHSDFLTATVTSNCYSYSNFELCNIIKLRDSNS
ncbi:hypothetical protein GIB67_019067 [Kingdonia uniflora]|uniref:Uncharacterized protein n=1 Tax=Kingdonia uniflora TaxID=39325 RepID=A0A7J7N032_9MAGN|nr:hypothetical protein GIB67_019067 [Kingdonia uniflora]